MVHRNTGKQSVRCEPRQKPSVESNDSKQMKWILVIFEIYGGGCAFLLLMTFCANLLRNEWKFDAEMKAVVWFIILWPIMTLTLLCWIPGQLMEISENKRLTRLSKERRQIEEGANTGQS